MDINTVHRAAQAQPSDPAPHDEARRRREAGRAAEPRVRPPLEIVVAEDNLIQRTYLVALIESLGYRTLAAENGQEALDLVKRTGAQIVISDYQMPLVNGIELTRKLRDLDLDHYVHIILITGSEQDDVRLEALEAGADDFLSKGRDPAALQVRIRAATRLIHHARELAEQHRVLREANDRINKDLKAAATAQRQLLPEIKKALLGTRIASAFVPSAVVSGDMFGCFALNGTKLGFYAVDVSGHGIHASLLSVAIGHLITPEYFANTALRAGPSADPAALVDDLNKRFSLSENDDYFTMFCGILDSETGQLDYCQAGYPSPFYLSPDGTSTVVGDGGFPVGMFADVTYENDAMQFECGGSLVICSDAAPEAENPDQGPFGSVRLQQLVDACHGADTDNIPERIVRALSDWRGGDALEDDLTVVALKRNER
ncbi:PP2C family protein-serine/threonine phosphatase [Pseudooceanicola aestuarii]|uniref:PP2C family protein-serine/threonine phosphatase n=1 Tax=Pseudooceanicola aestuarii TaxID=2697319 RepID=UPI0013D40998|nr:SpoIIE family protein phosphatase [Pseudooceanicola aestuarii]